MSQLTEFSKISYWLCYFVRTGGRTHNRVMRRAAVPELVPDLVSHSWQKERLVCTSLSGMHCRLERWRYVDNWGQSNSILMLLERWWCSDRQCRRSNLNCRYKLIQQRPEGKLWRNSCQCFSMFVCLHYIEIAIFRSLYQVASAALLLWPPLQNIF